MAQAPDGIDPADWVTVWQSEWAAMALDREVAESLAASAVAGNTAFAQLAQRDDAAGRAGTDAAAGTTPAGAAPGGHAGAAGA